MEKKIFLFCLSLACALHFSFAQNTALPSVEPLFLYDDGGSFDDEDIIKSALEFSECPASSAEGQAAFARYSNLKHSLVTPSFLALSQTERAEKILSAMYEKLLLAYKDGQTKVNVMFADGSYNCVSSSVLYLALAKASGLDVRGQVTPNHAFCTLYVSDGSSGAKAKVDVETTNPYGFDPGSKRNVQENSNGGGRYTIVPKRNYIGRYEVEDRMLVSLIGGNVAADYDKAGNWHKAVPMAAACVAFTQGCNNTAKRNREEFETACTNFVASLQRENKFATVLEWLDLLCGKWGAEKKLKNTYENSVSNYVVVLCRTGSFTAARECLDQRRKNVSVQAQTRIEQQIFESEVQWHLDAARNDDEAIAYLQSIRSQELAQSSRNAAKIKQRLEYYWVKKINAAQAEGDYLYAASIADQGLACVPGSGIISGAKKSCFRNYDSVFHNKFADLANKKRYDEALDVLNEGLSGNPESQVLNSDLKRLKKMMEKEGSK
ncbi:MAG: hypothetical protein J5817_07460 [Treponema sp.]|nr:hypothetical protein [Treponema sp.]